MKKRVSIEVAKALKEAGYPLEIKTIEDAENLGWQGKAFFVGMATCALLPYVMDVWLWLWREKGIKIVAEPRQKVFVYIKTAFYGLPKEFASVFEDPEEAIEKAIEYFITNNLIK